jgi:hypothetical protein
VRVATKNVGGARPRSAIGRQRYVLLPTRRNFFELPKISIACEYRQHIEPMVTDISQLLGIAEEVKRAVDG